MVRARPDLHEARAGAWRSGRESLLAHHTGDERSGESCLRSDAEKESVRSGGGI